MTEKKRAWLSLTCAEANAEIIEDNEDEMKAVILCPYCKQRTEVGETMMISGFVGCPNCYWVEGGLLNTVLYLRQNNYEAYRSGELYRNGFIRNREELFENGIIHK